MKIDNPDCKIGLSFTANTPLDQMVIGSLGKDVAYYDERFSDWPYLEHKLYVEYDGEVVPYVHVDEKVLPDERIHTTFLFQFEFHDLKRDFDKKEIKLFLKKAFEAKIKEGKKEAKNRQ